MDNYKGLSSRPAKPSLPSSLLHHPRVRTFSAFAADIASPPTEPVKGRTPTASTPVFVNKSVPGKNPAIDDQIEASYTLADVDGDTEVRATLPMRRARPLCPPPRS